MALNSEWIELRDGPTVRAEVIWLVLRLEDQGFALVPGDGDRLILRRSDGQQPADVLPDDDRAAIVKWKQPLLLVARYARHTS